MIQLVRNTYSEREKLDTGTLVHQTRYSMSNVMFILVFLMVPLIYCQVVQNEITIKMQELEKQMTSYQKQINDLSKKLFHIQTNPAWPSGKYCIFQSGSCPPGFSSSFSLAFFLLDNFVCLMSYAIFVLSMFHEIKESGKSLNLLQ